MYDTLSEPEQRSRMASPSNINDVTMTPVENQPPVQQPAEKPAQEKESDVPCVAFEPEDIQRLINAAREGTVGFRVLGFRV